jgi:hypothetical protein
MPKLPVRTGDLPTTVEDMPEDIPFQGIVKSLEVSDEPDKTGHHFLKGVFEIVEPTEWKGKKVFDNWIPIPGEDDDLSSPRGAEAFNRLSRLSASCKKSVEDTDDLIGEIATFTVKNDEYQGRKNQRVNDYYI